MILPSKHLKISESLLGFGGIILEILDKKSLDIDQIWSIYNQMNKKAILLHSYHSFDNLILALDYLYLISAIDINKNGKIYNAINQP